MKKKTFYLKVMDKEKFNRCIFDFRIIEERADRLQKMQRDLEGAFREYQAQHDELWGEINTLKQKLV